MSSYKLILYQSLISVTELLVWCSVKKAKIGAQQWRNAQESLISLENKNVASVDSIIRFVAFPESF